MSPAPPGDPPAAPPITIAPAFALIDADGRPVRLTEPFERLLGADSLQPPDVAREVERVVAGAAERMEIALQGPHVRCVASIEALLGPGGERFALVAAAVESAPSGPEESARLLAQFVDDSPAIVWLTDLEGRYLHVNPRYEQELGISADAIEGRTYAELEPSAVIDAPRMVGDTAGRPEPLQLEYTIPAFERRPPFAALRFPIRRPDGEPLAVCGIATGITDARSGHLECTRLLAVENWARGGAERLREEIMAEWDLHPLGGLSRAAPPATGGGALAIDPAAAAEAARLAAELRATHDELARTRSELEQARAQARHAAAFGGERTTELEQAVAQARAREQELAATVAEAGSQMESLRSEATTLRAEVATLRAERDSLRLEGQAARTAGEEQLSRVMTEHAERSADLDRALQEARSRIAALESELDAARRAVLDATAAGAERQSSEAELAVGLQRAHAELETSQSDLRASQAEVESVRDELRASHEELESARRELHASQAGLQGAGGELEAARAQLAAVQAELDATAAQLITAQGEADSLRAATGDQHARQAEELAAARVALEDTGAQLAAVQQELAGARAELEGSEERLAAAQARFGGTDNQLADANAQLTDANAQLVDANAQLTSVRAELDATAAQLRTAQGEADSLRAATGDQHARQAEELAAATVALEDTGAQLAAVQQELAGARAELTGARSRLTEVEAELEALRAAPPAEPAPSFAEASTPQPSPAADESARQWTSAAQLELTRALANASALRTALSDAVRIAGLRGGWDVAIAWSKDERGDRLAATAMWCREGDELAKFETGVWQHPQPAQSEVALAASSGTLAWFPDLRRTRDQHLSSAAAVGMQSAVLLPMRHGAETAGVLEFCARDAVDESESVRAALESIAMQLAHLGHLLKTGEAPRWRTGRM